ncbi:hypothetical protein CRUP_029088 [Coryphaenoides rupestris]|nr:hypothetical protein CRUP_029088 [Coryphaenoides rupestris]
MQSLGATSVSDSIVGATRRRNGPEAVVMKTTPPLGAGVLRKGSNVTLSCSTSSSPSATISWLYNGAAIPGKTGPTLVLSDLGEKQGGKYHCSASNAKTLRVANAPPAAFTITAPKEQLLAGAAMLNLTCAATAGSVSKVTWLKDGVQLGTANSNRVTFKKLQKGDAGQYICQLSNAVSSERASYKMVVLYGPDDVRISGDTAVEVKDGVTLTCNADSFPIAEFQWRFNGTKLDTKTAQLSIAAAAYKDTGTYICEAANARTNRTASATFQLAVKEEGALDEGLSGGAIAGIVIGVLLALVLAIVGVIYCKRKQTIESPY